MNLSIGADGHVFDVLILDILSDRAVKIVNYARCLFVLLFHSGILFSVEMIYMLFLNGLAYRCVIVGLLYERLLVDLFYSFFNSGG